MKRETTPLIRRSDYRPPDFTVTAIDLDVALAPRRARVKARLAVESRGETVAPELVLDGENLRLIAIHVDGRKLRSKDYRLEDTKLFLSAPGPSFTVETEVEINPSENTTLSGLYLSDGVFCTQCEAEGFRRITYALDRPDVMATYRTRIAADPSLASVLLANGNPVASGTLEDGRRFAEWHDPHPKPSYLFALVAGHLGVLEDSFRTRSARNVALKIYVEPGNEPRARYAMDALKRAMRWDEEAFGREYDLDIFMIVAVSAFNFGAMENKGLNIFNDKYILADPELATDADFANIESVVAHEYFHNWTGNRITCRDWFQLCLKEGLTVFRDQEFSAAMGSSAVKRIQDVKLLRLRQFAEDSGPLAHPPRPDSYLTIDNFYTATVYEKGAEICRMLRTVLGEGGFSRGMSLYFDRHDGEATTVDAFVTCFEDATGADLTQFRRWWSQAGTPTVTVSSRFDEESGDLKLTVSQSTTPTPGQKRKEPHHLPLRLAFLSPDGTLRPAALAGEAPWQAPAERVLHLTKVRETFTFAGLKEKPVLSLNRGFSAPVTIKSPQRLSDQIFLMGKDDDAFNRWEAGFRAGERIIVKLSRAVQQGRRLTSDRGFIEAFGSLLDDAHRDRAFTALAITLPGLQDVSLAVDVVDPEALHRGREQLVRDLALTHRDAFESLYAGLDTNELYRPDAAQMGRRALRNACLRYLCVGDGDGGAARALSHFERASNMTDRASALALLVEAEGPSRARALSAFRERYASHPLALDKWMTAQALSTRADVLDTIRALMRDPAFDIRNPNRVRALIHAFAHSNLLRFHAADGAGYRFAAEMVLTLDRLNPQVAARLAGAFESWRRFGRSRRAKMQAALKSLAAKRGLSRNVQEVVVKALGTPS